MSEIDQDVKAFAGIVFENVRQRYALDHRRTIPCLVIALGMAEGDMLFTNPEITKEEMRSATLKRLDEVRDMCIEVLKETAGAETP